MLKFLNHFKKSRPTDPLEIKIIQARHSFFAFLWDGSEKFLKKLLCSQWSCESLNLFWGEQQPAPSFDGAGCTFLIPKSFPVCRRGCAAN